MLRFGVRNSACLLSVIISFVYSTPDFVSLFGSGWKKEQQTGHDYGHGWTDLHSTAHHDHSSDLSAKYVAWHGMGPKDKGNNKKGKIHGIIQTLLGGVQDEEYLVPVSGGNKGGSSGVAGGGGGGGGSGGGSGWGQPMKPQMSLGWMSQAQMSSQMGWGQPMQQMPQQSGWGQPMPKQQQMGWGQPMQMPKQQMGWGQPMPEPQMMGWGQEEKGKGDKGDKGDKGGKSSEEEEEEESVEKSKEKGEKGDKGSEEEDDSWEESQQKEKEKKKKKSKDKKKKDKKKKNKKKKSKKSKKSKKGKKAEMGWGQPMEMGWGQPMQQQQMGWGQQMQTQQMGWGQGSGQQEATNGWGSGSGSGGHALSNLKSNIHNRIKSIKSSKGTGLPTYVQKLKPLFDVPKISLSALTRGPGWKRSTVLDNPPAVAFVHGTSAHAVHLKDMAPWNQPSTEPTKSH